MSVKVADNRVARYFDPGSSYLDTQAGTLNYCAPEVLSNKPYNEKCDMWSLRCVIHEVLTVQKTSKIGNAQRIPQLVAEGEFTATPDDCDAGLAMICHRLLNPDPENARRRIHYVSIPA